MLCCRSNNKKKSNLPIAMRASMMIDCHVDLYACLSNYELMPCFMSVFSVQSGVDANLLNAQLHWLPLHILHMLPLFIWSMFIITWAALELLEWDILLKVDWLNSLQLLKYIYYDLILEVCTDITRNNNLFLNSWNKCETTNILVIPELITVCSTTLNIFWCEI